MKTSSSSDLSGWLKSSYLRWTWQTLNSISHQVNKSTLICCRWTTIAAPYFQYQNHRRKRIINSEKKQSVFSEVNYRRVLLLYFFLFVSSSWPCVQSKYYDDSSSEELYSGKNHVHGNFSEVGMSPPVLNLATRADIYVNATCGEREPETYCKLVEHVHSSRTRTSHQCQVCDDQAGKGKRHPIRYAIDGSNRWWQSPTLQNGRQFEWVTITIDLKQVYQVAYIIIKASISPRPGNWILERSLDGIVYSMWQIFAINDEECWNRYRIRAKPGKPHYNDDEEVICTSYYSSLYPLEGGEIHTSLVNGRPGADGPSERLTKFTMARYVRLRMQKIRTLHGDLMNVGGPDRSSDKSVMRRYFYSIRDISIGGHCVCFGHANECLMDLKSQSERCMCQHNTCGDRCDVCCPLYNQYPWGAGNSTSHSQCHACECHGQADSCVFDPVIAEKRLSMNALGVMDGGGVCLDCKAHTTGINCGQCEKGYYKPKHVLRNDVRPCVKCECNNVGSMGSCVADEDEALRYGKEPGSCICKEGFSGKYCNQCEMGYRGFPDCEPCPCHLPGIVNMECEGDCICKENVQGNTCGVCKKGYYNLIKQNPEGCTKCFCHLVTDKCESSNFAITQVMDQDNWFVTDLHGTKVIALSSNGGMYQIANEEFNAFSMYYWGNAKTFSGNRVLSYGLNMTFHVTWESARGDTSGRPITDYDLIIQSTNNMLAFSNNFYEGNNATVHVTLNEINCFVLPDIDNNIIQRTPTPTLGTPCTRIDVMEGIHDVKRLLIRAKYHTDQIDGMLGYSFMEKADLNEIAGPGQLAATSVEVCSCPKEYAGTSCQECAYGYRKRSKDSWPNECIKCDCNGHSSTCGFDGKCNVCEHNTIGDNCEKCKEGYYGNPSSESPFSCKPCECPLAITSNNFSPTCQISENSYECTACPVGYEGPFCERCTSGYFGNPTQPGDYCKPCACNLEGSSSSSDNICDHLTGECLVCSKNTVGWNCDECLVGHYGNPLNGSCNPCSCHSEGSYSATCDPGTGQCPCKDNFYGRRCNECVVGHGNPDEGCLSCGCNQLGSQSTVCDKITGQCKCKPGIGGRYCNKCLDLHFGFSTNGCLACSCHPEGSDSAVCDLKNGQCHCLANVKGRKCDTCYLGYWNIKCGTGCVKCDCDPLGSVGNTCDDATGQCLCKPGVGGLRCDRCLDNCYGFNEDGCKSCDPCIKPGHICDSATGRCTCPPNSEGKLCEKCTVGSWGYPLHGCQPCNCSQQGSTTPQCSPETGRCNCAPGFEGDKCNKCKVGHYNYPHCTPCMCDTHGTDARFCNSDGQCSCANSGQCHCKENVVGAKCDRCREGTYGLDQENPEGCIECFCFGRTNKCSQGYFKWQRLVLPADRSIIPSRRSENQLKIVNNLIVIPDHANDVIIEKDISFSAPLYWQLPHIFLGDKVLSYNGYIRFRTDTIAGSTLFPPRVLASYPLVQIQSFPQRNPQLILEYFPENFDPMGYSEVRLHEDEWRLKNGPSNGLVTKETMMVALHNLHHVLIRGTHSPEVLNATLFNVSLDIAVPLPNGDKSMVHGIEVCDCPPQYNSTSCQNPRIGFYRWYKRDYITSTVIIDLVGEARPCECNGRSNVCDTETGFCQNCSENFGGRYCDHCAIGHYGDLNNKCLPCPCPSIWNNHAESCYKPPLSNQFQCFCRPGYTGKACERCDYGWYGKPWETGGHCKMCNCNAYGSVSDECHEVTGQCNCRPGVTGRDCSKCSTRHVIIEKTCTSCDDHCSGVLLNEVEQMSIDIKDVHVDKAAVSAIKHLMHMDNISQSLLNKSETRLIVKTFFDDIPTYETVGDIMTARADELEQSCADAFIEAHGSKRKVQDLTNQINLIKNEIRGTIIFLDDYVQGKIVIDSDPSFVESEITKDLDNLKITSDVLEEMTDKAEEELDGVNDLFENVLVKIFNSTAVSKLQDKMREMRNNLDDLMQYISQANKNSDEAVRIVITAKEFLDTGRVNVDLMDTMTINMDMKAVMTATTLSEGGYISTELDQVLLMLEDIMIDLRNNTKEVELKETSLFDMVPLYRVNYSQPAFDHVEGLKQHAKYLEGLLVRLNGSEPFAAVTAYQRIVEGFVNAFELAKNASKFSSDARLKIEGFLSEYSTTDILETSSQLMREGLLLSGIVENSMRSNLSSCKSDIDSLKWRMKVANESLRNINQKIESFDESRHLKELLERIGEISETVTEVSMSVMETEAKIQKEFQQSRIYGIKNGSSPIDSVDATFQVDNAQYKLDQVKAEAVRAERREKHVEKRIDSAKDKMKYLKSLIKQARHKANTVGVSIGPDDTGTCFRLYKWPVIDSATSIRFNFAPTKKSDSLLFYWPSSINDDFVSIEMVDRQIKASWELGSGLRTLIHPRKLVDISENSDDPDFWVQISLERVGSSVQLDVQPVSSNEITPTNLRLSSSSIVYHNIDDELTLMDLSPDDLIHIGGMSKQMRQGLVTNGLSGCIHNLQVNQKSIGLWNFVGNEGCAPCVECPDFTDEPPTGDLEYYFDGRGYSVVDRLQSKAFNSKFFDVSVQFRTLSENGLIFLTVNDTLGQMISLELKEGRVVFQVRHKWNDKENSLSIESKGDEIYNNGEWVNVRAVWVFQKGTQTGKLMIEKKDFSQDKKSSSLSLDLYNAAYHIGGVSPAFDPVKWQDLLSVVPYVGCMKNVLINNSPYDPLSGNYFGVESPCRGKVIYVTSFEGDGFAEFASQPMKKSFKFGLSFKTLAPTGLLLLSTSAKSLDSPDEHYYAVYLENGQIRVQIGIPLGPIDLIGNGTRYDDGKFHSIRFVKKIRRLYLYVDDEEITDSRLPKQSPTVSAPFNRGLFIGGTNTDIQNKFSETPLPVTKGFSGCIQNFYFDNELQSFNYPISHKNQNLGQCPKHHEYDSSAVPNHFLYPNTIGTLGINRFDIVGRFSEESCSSHEHIIEPEDPLKSLQFGNSPNSYITLNLDGTKTLKQRFNITFNFRTFYPNGLFFQGLKKKGNGGQCLITYLKDGQIIVKFFGERPQELVSPLSNLNDGQWHQISIVKADDKMFLHVDNRNASQTKVSKIKAMSKLNIGGIPPNGHDCLENSIQKPEHFKGCLKNFVINSHQVNLDTNHAVLNEVNPCFRFVEKGTFFRAGSFAIYTYNLTLGNIMELQLDFRSDSRNGLLLSFIPNKSTKYPSFSIFLENGKVIARETSSNEDFYEAVGDFENDRSFVCDGNWHSIRANYEKGSITLRLDNFEPIFALAEPTRPTYTNGNAVVGSLFIGGVEEGASHLTKKLQFHGCIRNISVNRQRKDWTDMALLSHVYLNSCPT